MFSSQRAAQDVRFQRPLVGRVSWCLAAALAPLRLQVLAAPRFLTLTPKGFRFILAAATLRESCRLTAAASASPGCQGRGLTVPPLGLPQGPGLSVPTINLALAFEHVPATVSPR